MSMAQILKLLQNPARSSNSLIAATPSRPYCTALICEHLLLLGACCSALVRLLHGSSLNLQVKVGTTYYNNTGCLLSLTFQFLSTDWVFVASAWLSSTYQAAISNGMARLLSPSNVLDWYRLILPPSFDCSLGSHCQGCCSGVLHRAEIYHGSHFNR